MADTLNFEDVLSVVRENNPKLLESWKDRKISGAKTILDSKLKRKVVDEVRFKLKGGAQISFIGDDDQEKLVKIVGGKDKAQKSLEYIRRMTEENSESLSEEDKIASDILTTSLEKYIKVLEARQTERNQIKKKDLPTIEEMQGKMDEIDASGKTDKEKQKEKKEYMIAMQEKYQKELDILKHKLEGIRLKLADKTIITKLGDKGTEVKNFDAINNLYEQFQSLTTAAYDYGQAFYYVRETLEKLREERIVMQPIIKKKKAEDDDKDKKEEKKDEIKLIDFGRRKDGFVRKFRPVYTDGEIAYKYGRYRDKVWMKRTALDMDIESGVRKETIFTKSPFIRNLMAFLPNRRLKRSAIKKISRDEMNVGEIYDIHSLGEIRWASARKAEELGLFDDYEDDEVVGEYPELSEMYAEIIRENARMETQKNARIFDNEESEISR